MAKKNPTFDLMDYDCDLTHRIIFLGSQKSSISGDESGVDSALADRALKALYLMNKLAPGGDKPIEIIINNPGGDWYHGMSIYSAVERSINPITMHGTGLIASMASVIMQAAKHRTMDRHSKMLVHWGSAGFYGHTKMFLSWAEEEKRNCTIMEQIYMRRILEKNPDYKLKTFKDLINFDAWLNAEQALELGLIDEII